MSENQRKVFCVKLKKDAIGLDSPPYPNDIGQRIYQHISQEAWQLWLKQQTMLINENRLSMRDPKSRALLTAEMEKFLFGEGSVTPPGYVPPK